MKIYNKSLSLIIGISGLFFFNSCGISDEMNKLNSVDSIQASTSFNANILNGTWLLKDLVPFDESSDGSISFDQDIAINTGMESPLSSIDLDDSNFEIKDGKILLKARIISEVPINIIMDSYYNDNEDSDDNDEISTSNSLFGNPIVLTKGTNNIAITLDKAKFDILKKFKFQHIKLAIDGKKEGLNGNQKLDFKIGIGLNASVKAKLN